MELGNRAALQNVKGHVGGVGAQLGVVDAAGGEAAGLYEGVRAGVVGDPGPVEDFSHGNLSGHDHIVGGGEYGIHTAYQRVRGSDDFVGAVAGLLKIRNALAVQICLGFGDGHGGVGLGVGVEQAHGLNIGVGCQHHVQNESGVQSVRGAGDLIKTGQACGRGIGDSGVDDGCIGALGGGDHGLSGQSCDGDDHVNLVTHDLCGDLAQHGGVVLSIVFGNGQLNSGGIGLGLHLGGNGGADLVQRGVIQLLHDGDGVAGGGCLGLGGLGFRGSRGGGGGSGGRAAAGQHRSGEDQRRNDRNNLFHGKYSYTFYFCFGKMERYRAVPNGVSTTDT